MNTCHAAECGLKFIFVDAENIGLKGIEAINTSISDKVFVFSKNDAIKEVCERKLFLYISSYPVGPNQADFYIVGNLVGVIMSLTEKQRGTCHFVLYSQDNPLVKAFEFQCKLHKIAYTIALEPKNQPVPQTQAIKQNSSAQSLEQKIYQQFKTAQTAESVRKKLNQSKSDFTRALNILIKANKIQRVSNSKKSWICASTH